LTNVYSLGTESDKSGDFRRLVAVAGIHIDVETVLYALWLIVRNEGY